MVLNRRYERKPYGDWGIRHLQLFLVFVGLTIAYALRVNLSVAIVAMTDKMAVNTNYPIYDWDEQIKPILLSSFFWGYVCTQLPAGQLSEKYGPKITLFLAVFLSALMTFLTPICASFGSWKMVCALRVLEGLCQGFIFPSTHTFISKWAPLPERAQFVTYCYSGKYFGTVIMLATSGILASSLGWPSIFYMSGAAGIIWSIVWIFFGSDSPSSSKYISDEERMFIENSQGKTVDTAKKIKLHAPWKSIFTSIPFFALLIVHATHNWGFFTLLTEIPTYMRSALGLDIKQNAILSSMPYLACLILSFFFSYLSGFLVKSDIVPLKYSRKLFNTIGHWIPMCALIALGYVTKGQTHIAVILLVVAVGLGAACGPGFMCNHIDLAPNYAGTLMGITNGVGNLMSIMGPLVVKFVVTNETDPSHWRYVFFIAAAFYFCGNLIFIIFSTTDTQSWNEIKRKDIVRNNSV